MASSSSLPEYHNTGTPRVGDTVRGRITDGDRWSPKGTCFEARVTHFNAQTRTVSVTVNQLGLSRSQPLESIPMKARLRECPVGELSLVSREI
ncbi:MAG TPA: hypothetical protein PLO23_07935 [Alphaproteobacteria bacterium]|nr:hypothetical protein [Alphaproteobacteria bacterium]